MLPSDFSQPAPAALTPAALPPPLRVEMTSDPAALAGVRRAVEQLAGGGGLDTRAVADVGLCVNEALANVFRHAYHGARGRPVVVTAGWEPDGGGGDCGALTLRVTIRDWGDGVNPAALPPRRHDPEIPGGLGLICLRELMDSIHFSPQPDGMLLTMTKRRGPSPTC